MRSYRSLGTGPPPAAGLPLFTLLRRFETVLPASRLDVITATGALALDGVAFTANVARFVRILRRAGLEVEPGQTATFLNALVLLGFDRRGRCARGRACNLRPPPGGRPGLRRRLRRVLAPPQGRGEVDGRLPRITQRKRDGSGDESVTTVRPGRTADFASLTPAETRDGRRGTALALAPPVHPPAPLRPGLPPAMRRASRGLCLRPRRGPRRVADRVVDWSGGTAARSCS